MSGFILKSRRLRASGQDPDWVFRRLRAHLIF
jgi:hypothetical protein